MPDIHGEISAMRLHIGKLRREMKALKEWKETAQPIIAGNRTDIETLEAWQATAQPIIAGNIADIADPFIYFGGPEDPLGWP